MLNSKVTRHPPFWWPVPGQMLSPKMSPILTLNGEKCAKTQSNTSYYGSHLTHRQRRHRMTYKRSRVNNNNLEAAKRKEKVCCVLTYLFCVNWQGFFVVFFVWFFTSTLKMSLIFISEIRLWRTKSAKMK